MVPTRPRSVVAAVLALPLLAVGLHAAPAHAAKPGEPALWLRASTASVTAERMAGQPILDLNLGTLMVAGDSSFEVRVTRKSYDDPIEARQVIRQGNVTRDRILGRDVVQRFGGFADFFRLSLSDAVGDNVLDTTVDYCPGAEETLRLKPDAPDSSPYPQYCSWNPFTLGSVWGIQRGWGTFTGRFLVKMAPGVVIPDGLYQASLSVTSPYRRVFGIPDDTANVQVEIRTVAQPSPHHEASVTAGSVPKPNKSAPTRPSRPPAGPRPDLIALPAWSITPTGDDPDTPETERDLLTFTATIWNAGPSPLVVDGFRRTDEAVMDAYQYFYDGEGNQVGYAPTNQIEWDPRDGHEHWHFKDFAGYRLLNADKTEVVRSQKESFCITATDAINHFVKNAAWQSALDDLHTSCGGEDALSIREVLEVGTGDTYGQYLPGQAFEIHDLPNGIYYIQIIANPNGGLYETDLTNNTSLRKVILGGTPGHRTVQVPAYGLVDSEGSGDGGSGVITG